MELAKGARILQLVEFLQHIPRVPCVSATQGTRGQMEKHVQFAMQVHIKKVWEKELVKVALWTVTTAQWEVRCVCPVLLTAPQLWRAPRSRPVCATRATPESPGRCAPLASRASTRTLLSMPNVRTATPWHPARLVALLQQIVSATQGTRGQMEKHVQFAMEVHLKQVWEKELAKGAPFFRLLQLVAKY